MRIEGGAALMFFATLLAQRQTGHPPDVSAIGTQMVTVIGIAIALLAVAAVLVATGRMDQKGPHGRRFWR